MISVNIASIPERKEQLINTLKSLLKQSLKPTKINVCLNNYKEIPLEHHLINYVFSDNSLGDAGKFMFKDSGYYLTCDDDLIYPFYYIENMVKAINDFKNCIITYHARNFYSFPINSYYRSKTNKRSRCLDEEKHCEKMQFGGTGVMGFHTDIIKPPIELFKKSNMADIWIGLYADSKGVDIYCLPHSLGYIKYQIVDNTIWDNKNRNDTEETRIVNNYFENGIL